MLLTTIKTQTTEVRNQFELYNRTELAIANIWISPGLAILSQQSPASYPKAFFWKWAMTLPACKTQYQPLETLIWYWLLTNIEFSRNRSVGHRMSIQHIVCFSLLLHPQNMILRKKNCTTRSPWPKSVKLTDHQDFRKSS